MITGDHEKGCAYHKGLKCDCILTNGLRKLLNKKRAGLAKQANASDLKSDGPKDLIGSIPMPGTKDYEWVRKLFIEERKMPVIEDVLKSLKEIEALHKRKNDDYANDKNPFQNFDDTIVGLIMFENPQDQVYVWPIYNKLSRLANLLNRDTPAVNESIEDSLLDITTYVLLWKADLVRRRAIDTK